MITLPLGSLLIYVPSRILRNLLQQRAVLKRVVVLSAVPGVADLSPALLNLTDSVFRRKSAKSSENNENGLGRDSSSMSRSGGSRAVSSGTITNGSISSARGGMAGIGGVEGKGNTDPVSGCDEYNHGRAVRQGLITMHTASA